MRSVDDFIIVIGTLIILLGQGSADKAADGMLNRSGAVGTEALMGVLKNYCRSLNLKTAITVGVIGYPNVGKSSLINSLKRYVKKGYM